MTTCNTARISSLLCPRSRLVGMLYAITLGGALYLEFGPIRKARAAAMAASREKTKKGKGE